MVKTKLTLYNGNKDSKGRSSISVYISRPFRIYIGSGFFAKPDEWDENTSLYLGRNARAVNASLEQHLSDTIRKLTELKESGRLSTITSKELREELAAFEKKEEKITLEAMINKVGETKSDSRKRAYKTLILNIERYGKQYLSMPMEALTRSWIEGFSHFMLEKTGLKRNSVGENLNVLSHVVKIALDDEVIIRNPFRRFTIPREQTRSRALSVEDLRTIWFGDFGKRNYYRDIFKLCFLLLGINISDLMDAKLSDIRNGRLEYRRNKTGRLFSVKVVDEAWEIINQLKGKERIIEMAEKSNSPEHNVWFNLRKLGPKEKPLFPKLTTYWARHTWATIAAELDIPTDVISEALGHQHTGSKVTGVYVRYSLIKVDEANRKVIDYVLGKN